jgi:hypothetical protein
MRAPIATSLLLFALAACGRTTAQAVVADGDAGEDTNSDATDANADADGSAGAGDAAGPRMGPLFAAAATADCPVAAEEASLRVLGTDESLVLVETKALDECSGAGGEYLIGAAEGGAVDLFLGGHTCYFLDAELRSNFERTWWGVARVGPAAEVLETPVGWCITSLSGSEPVRSDSSVLAWALYESEAEARAAFEALRRP